MATIAATTQNVFPVRVQLAVTGLSIGEQVVIYRVVAGTRTPVRGGVIPEMETTTLIVVDAELPFGVPVQWVLNVDNADEDDTGAPSSYTLTGGLPVVSDAIVGDAVAVKILSWPTKAMSRDSALFNVGGRNVAVFGPLADPLSTITFRTETDSQRRDLVALLRRATAGIVQIRQPGGYDDIDGYVAVRGIERYRVRAKGSVQTRDLVIDAIEVEGWAPGLVATGFTLGDIAAAYPTPLDLGDIGNDFATLYDIAIADWS